MSRNEIFVGLGGNSYVGNQLNLELFVGVSARKLGLGHFTPTISLISSYDFFKRNQSLVFGPGIMSRLTTIYLNKGQRSNLVEGGVGYQFLWGDRIRLVHGAFYGLGLENGPHKSVEYRTYWVTLGISYALN